VGAQYNYSAQPERINMETECQFLMMIVSCPTKQGSQVDTDMPKSFHPALEVALRDHEALFRCQLDVARHAIDTDPVRHMGPVITGWKEDGY